MSKARDLANAGTALTTVSATELGYLDGVTSAVQTQINSKEATLPSQTGNSGKYLTTDGSSKSWGTVSQYALPSQTGNSGKFLTTNGTAESWGTVNQPITWTQRLTANVDNNSFTKIEYNGSNLWVAVGSGGLLYSSTDGKTWTSRTSQFGADGIQDVAYGNGLWVAVGSAGKISTSSDGTTWTARTANMGTNTINAVTYANSLWVAVGNGGGTTNTGGITYSTNGTTWTRKSQSLTVGAAYYTVIWNGTNWIVGASDSTNNYLYASTPSGTWTAAASGSGSATHKVIWDGTRNQVLTGGSYATTYYSTNNTTLGTLTVQPGGPQITVGTAQMSGTFMYYSGKYYITNGTYLQSFAAVSGNPTLDYLILLPSQLYHLTPFIYGGCNSIWVGATGYIVAGGQGQIYTSF